MLYEKVNIERFGIGNLINGLFLRIGIIGIFKYDGRLKKDFLNFLERRVMNWYFVYIEYGCVVVFKEVSFFNWN